MTAATRLPASRPRQRRAAGQQVARRRRGRARRAARGHRHQHRQRRAHRHAGLARRDAQQVSWVVSSYGVANVIILPLTAWLGHRFGKKRYFIFSLIGFTLASVLCGIATNLPMLSSRACCRGSPAAACSPRRRRSSSRPSRSEEQAMAQGFFGAIVIAGPGDRPDARRLHRHQHRLALDLLHQHAGRHRRRCCMCAAPSCRRTRRSAARSAPIDWLAIGLLALGLGCAADGARGGQLGGLVRLAVHRHAARVVAVVGAGRLRAGAS